MILTSQDIKILSAVKPAFINRLSRRPILSYDSKDIGGAGEFADYRQYTSGENIRHIDWNKYKSDRGLVLKKFEHQQKPKCYLFADISTSAQASGKINAIKKMAAAISFILLNNGVELYIVSDGVHKFEGSSKVEQAFKHIESIGNTLQPSLNIAQAMIGANGNLIIISDMIRSEGFGVLTDIFDKIFSSSLLICIYNGFDIEPSITGAYRLVDSQNSGHINVDIDRVAIARYKRRRQAYFDLLQTYCNKRQWLYRSFQQEDELKKQIQEILTKGLFLI